MSYTVGIVGKGFVGGAMYENFKDVFNVLVWDKDEQKRNIDNFEDFVNKTDIIFVCVPTPMKESGECDTSIVISVIKQIASIDRRKYVVIKSTVTPGTTEKLSKEFGMVMAFNPEFLTEANALDDMRNQNRIILGGPRPWINAVKQVFQTAFPKVPIIKTSSTTAEMIKYLTNNFLTIKVAFANEMAQICEALDAKGLNVDYDKVVEYAKYDSRLGTSHWSVPGPDGARGYGGHCFPKDINAMIDVAKKSGVDPKVLTAAWEKNLEVRSVDERDWEKMSGRAVSKRST